MAGFLAVMIGVIIEPLEPRTSSSTCPERPCIGVASACARCGFSAQEKRLCGIWRGASSAGLDL